MLLELSSFLKKHLPENAFDDLFHIPGEIFREVKNRKTVKFNLGGKNFFIKTHNGCGWKEIFKELLQGRLPVVSAKREWCAIERLQSLGVKTTQVVGKGERGWNPARMQSFIVTEALEGMITLEDLVEDWGGAKGEKQVLLKRTLLKKLAQLSRTIHGAGINHRDYYICHFMVKQRNWKMWKPEDDLDIFLMDLHRVQIRKKVPKRWIAKDLAGLLFSALDCGLTKRDILRFVRLYCNQDWYTCIAQERYFWDQILHRTFRLYQSLHGKPPKLSGIFANSV
jgi:heptose I phosphotransferase